MPFSSALGKETIREWMRLIGYDTVLDVGAGCGTYSMLLRSVRPLASWTALEVHEPYVAEFGLKAKYDDVIVQDVRSAGFPPATYDVVLLGDVLEHLLHPDALDLLSSARRWAAKAVMASLPLGPCPQGPSEDNEHETHRSTWDHLELMALRPTAAKVHKDASYTIGTYLWRADR